MNPEYFGGDVYWCVVKDIKPLIFDTAEKLTEEGLNNCSAKVWPVDSVIISLGATIGQIGIAKVPTATKQGLAGIVLNRQMMMPEFLAYGLLGQKEYIQSLATGATIKEIRPTRFVETIQLPVPPLTEQQRIVGLLDEALEGLATAKANAEKNLQNARALFESHLQSVFSQRGPDWVTTRIGDQLTLQRGFDITKDQQRTGTVPVISSGGTKSYHDSAMAKGPGVVIGRKGTLGKVFYVEDDYWPHDTTLWVKDFKGNEPRFVYYLFAGLDVKKLDSGTANPALNRNLVHPIQVAWPRIGQQKAIVDTLDSLQEETQRLARIYEQKLAALEALKKSLLHQAFSGQL